MPKRKKKDKHEHEEKPQPKYKVKKYKFLGWNIFLSYSEQMDRAAQRRGWVFLGHGKDNHQTEFQAYRMWKRKDKLKEEK